MQQTPAGTQANPGYLTIAQLIVSGLGLALSLLGAAFLALIGLVGVMSENPSMPDTVPLFALAWVSLLVAVLAVPSLVFSIRRLMHAGPDLKLFSGFRAAGFLILLWPLVLAIGDRFANHSLAWLLMPPLQILAIGLPIWFIVEMTRRGLPAGSRQRGWGLFNFGMFISTPTAVVVEVIVFVGLGALVALWVGSQPELLEELERLSQRLMVSPGTPEEILELVRPYLQNPLVVFGIIALLAGITPLMEELIKPIAIWALAGRNLTPAEGFVAGALCGGSFALIESLMTLSSTIGDGWAALVVGRAGTALLHIATTALVGWGLASAWSEGKYLRLGLAYLTASAVHGIWNVFSLLNGLDAVLNPAPANLAFISGLARVSSAGLVILAGLLFLLLWSGNRRLRQASPAVEPALLPPVEDRLA